MRIAVITQAELAKSHGTGAQILQMLHASNFHHFFWTICHGHRGDQTLSTHLANPIPPLPKLRWIVRQCYRASGTSWWRANRVNARRFNSVLKHLGHFDVAYVVVASETDACRANSLLEILNVPYVLNVVDIFHPEGLTPEMVHFRTLVKSAAEVFSLLPSITHELNKICPRQIEELLVGKPLAQVVAQRSSRDGALRIITGGRPYRGGCELLAEAWPRVLKALPRATLSYVGPHYHEIPASLRPFCINDGFIADDLAYQRHLAGAHLAFLSGPDKVDQFGRFSFPSRAADFMFAGLPIIACVPSGTSTRDVLMPLEGDGVFFWTDPEDLVKTITNMSEPSRWASASERVLSFASSRMSLDAVRSRVLKSLLSAASSGGRVTRSL